MNKTEILNIVNEPSKHIQIVNLDGKASIVYSAKFVELFSKGKFSKESIVAFCEERIQEINVLSANVSDVLERREHLLNLEAEIKRCQEDERKKRLAKTEEYAMLVFSLAGTSVEKCRGSM